MKLGFTLFGVPLEGALARNDPPCLNYFAQVWRERVMAVSFSEMLRALDRFGWVIVTLLIMTAVASLSGVSIKPTALVDIVAIAVYLMLRTRITGFTGRIKRLHVLLKAEPRTPQGLWSLDPRNVVRDLTRVIVEKGTTIQEMQDDRPPHLREPQWMHGLYDPNLGSAETGYIPSTAELAAFELLRMYATIDGLHCPIANLAELRHAAKAPNTKPVYG